MKKGAEPGRPNLAEGSQTKKGGRLATKGRWPFGAWSRDNLPERTITMVVPLVKFDLTLMWVSAKPTSAATWPTRHLPKPKIRCMRRSMRTSGPSRLRRRMRPSTKLPPNWQERPTLRFVCLKQDSRTPPLPEALPAKYRRRLRTTNMVERFIEEIRRREKVVRIFPRRNSCVGVRPRGSSARSVPNSMRNGPPRALCLNMDEYYRWKDAHAKPEPLPVAA